MSGASVMAMDGGSADILLVADTIGSTTVSGTSTLTINFNSDGSITYSFVVGTGDAALNSRWFSDGSGGSIRWVRMTVNSGTVTTGTTGTVLALSSNRTWTQQRTVLGQQTANVTMEIFSDAAGTQLVQSAAWTIYAERTGT